nr:unnamed protein product [Digitaria exilis]
MTKKDRRCVWCEYYIGSTACWPENLRLQADIEQEAPSSPPYRPNRGGDGVSTELVQLIERDFEGRRQIYELMNETDAATGRGRGREGRRGYVTRRSGVWCQLLLRPARLCSARRCPLLFQMDWGERTAHTDGTGAKQDENNRSRCPVDDAGAAIGIGAQ